MLCYINFCAIKISTYKKAFSLSVDNHAVKNSPNGKKHTFILIEVF